MALAAALAGCHDAGSVAPTPPTLAGTYRLRTINGAPPPAVISQNSQRAIALTGATMQIGVDDRFVLDDTLRVTTAGGVLSQIDHRTGSYRATATQVTFTPEQPGALDVTTLTRTMDGVLTLVDATGSVPVAIVFQR